MAGSHFCYDRPMDRPKFLRRYANGVQLRVEQIGPNLWSGAVYLGAIPAEFFDTPGHRRRWHVFTALTEEAAKRQTMTTVNTLQPEGPWVALFHMTDQDWARDLAELGFPGHLTREGVERWNGF
jgi:hypothetical protein